VKSSSLKEVCDKCRLPCSPYREVSRVAQVGKFLVCFSPRLFSSEFMSSLRRPLPGPRPFDESGAPFSFDEGRSYAVFLAAIFGLFQAKLQSTIS